MRLMDISICSFRVQIVCENLNNNYFSDHFKYIFSLLDSRGVLCHS